MSHYRAIQRDREVTHSLERGLKEPLICFSRVPVEAVSREHQARCFATIAAAKMTTVKKVRQTLAATVESPCCTQKPLGMQALAGKQDSVIAQLVQVFRSASCVYKLIHSYPFISKKRLMTGCLKVALDIPL